MKQRAGTCWHCGEAIPSGVEIQALIQGENRPMCCHGCQMVANLIAQSGLDRYYDFRDALPERPEIEGAQAEDYVAWDRPAVLAHYAKVDCNGFYTIHLVLENVHCAACAWLIQRFLMPLPGIADVSVDTTDGRVLLRWNPNQTHLSQVGYRLAQLGYIPHLDSPGATLTRNQSERRNMLKAVVVAGIGMMQVMSYALAGYIGAFQDLDAQSARFFQLVSMLVAAPVALYSGRLFYQAAWSTLKQRRLGMDVPVATAILVALSASIYITFFGHGETYFDSVVMFIFFLLLGRYAVMVTRQQAGQLHSALARALPAQVSRVIGEGTENVALIELNMGDRVALTAGETIPADGIIVDGEASIDESLMSGEAKPHERRLGDSVLAGSLILSGQLMIVIEKLGQETALSNIVRLLDQARHFRPQSAKMADRVAGWFIACVLLGAGLAGLAWSWQDPQQALPIMLSILVVSCPCALALGTPVALAASARGFAELGILIHQPDVLETLPSISHVIFDKTGTLTESTMHVAAMFDADGHPIDDASLLTLAGRLERRSRHPIASAFAAHDDQGKLTDWVEHSHRGVSASIDGQLLRLGKPEFIATKIPESLSASWGGTWVGLADEEKLLAWFRLDNSLREGAHQLIATLRRQGRVIWLASGDGAASVDAVAQQLGIDRVEAQCSPEDKLALMRSLQAVGHRVAMVGDGINDAPVLAGADVSIALADGADIAKTQADMISTGQSLEHIHQVFELAPRVHHIIRQNLTWAIAYNLLAFPLAAAGWVPPWAAAIGMSASSLLVVLNGRRARARLSNRKGTPHPFIRDQKYLNQPKPSHATHSMT